MIKVDALGGGRNAVEHRLGLLADVADALSGTLDAGHQAQEAGRALVGRLGGWCVLDLVDEDQSVRRTVVRAGGAGSGEHAQVLTSRAERGSGPLGRVRAESGPQVLAGGAAVGALVGELGVAADLRADSVIVAPLVARDEAIGALALAGTEPVWRLGPDDVPLVAEVAARIALAVDNARLHAAAAAIGERFQRALLPDLPKSGGLRFCARYSAAATAGQVGGDWYDAFELPDGDTALIIGDVNGHDLAAAVTMSQLRNMVRGIACDRQEPPGLILQRLDRACCQLYPGTLTTCLYALVKTEDDGRRRLQHASAGHPPPLLVTVEGDTAFLEGARAMLLGVDPETRRPSAADPLPPGSTVVLYTDGLFERRGQSLDVGLARLRRVAATAADRPIEEFCDTVLSGMDLTRADDTAVLGVRIGDGA